MAIDTEQAKRLVDEHYKKVAQRWQERVTDRPFMQQLRAGKLPQKAVKIFFRNWGSYSIEINTLEAASYHKHSAFFRKHRDLMGPMAAKLADELIHPKRGYGLDYCGLTAVDLHGVCLQAALDATGGE